MSSRTAVNATINPIPADPTTTGGNLCGTGSTTTLTASGSDIFWYDDATGTNQVGTGNNFVTPVLSATTIYYAQSSNGTCESNFVPATATLVSLPTVSVGPDTAIEIGTAYILDAGPGFVTYLWNTSDQTQQLTIYAPDTFCVEVTDANGCSATDCAIIDFFVGINGDAAISIFSIYPNPSYGNVNITFNEKMKNATLSVVDVSGKIIFNSPVSNTVAGTTISINTSDFSSGVYFVKVSSDEKQFSGKLMIE